MTTPMFTTATAAALPPIQPALTLDDLAARSFAELEALYRAAHVPSSLADFDGALDGRLLAVRHLDRGPLGAILRRLVASKSFVWAGKSLRAQHATSGTGINRLVVPGVLGRQELFPFTTSIAPSLLDGRDTIFIDYERPDNPPFVRGIRDEIRQVAPGLLLGPAMWKRGATGTTVLWFALAVPGR